MVAGPMAVVAWPCTAAAEPHSPAAERVVEGAAELRLEESDEDELALESNDEGDSHRVTPEGNEGVLV